MAIAAYLDNNDSQLRIFLHGICVQSASPSCLMRKCNIFPYLVEVS